MKHSAFAFLTALIVFTLPALGQSTDKVEHSDVRETLNTYDRAWNRKDVKAVGEMLVDDYVYFSSVGTLITKKSTLEFLAKPDYKLTFVKRSEHKVHSDDGKIAIVSSRWQGKGSWSGGEINDDQRCGQVFAKRRGVWKMLSENCVQITAK